MDEKYCKHCWPTQRKNHLRTHFHYLTGAVRKKVVVLSPDFLDKITNKLERWGWPLLLNFLSFLGVVSFEDDPDYSQLRNRSLIFWKEAQRRGIELKQIKIFGKPLNHFRMNYNQNRYYEAIPLTINQNWINFDDKFQVKQILKEEELPTPSGRVFLSTSKALDYARDLDFPLVVKPRFGSLSEHATWDIQTEEGLKKAIKIARQYQPGFLVEEYLEGALYRATVMGQKVFICKKERANVVGDGENTIRELIKGKNEDPKRGAPQQKNTTLHKIPIDKKLIRNLKQQNLSLNSVLEKDRKVYLHRKIILSQGCDVIECTAQTHPDNKKLFKKIARLLKTDLVGLDYIAPDIATSYKKQRSGIIEANSLPYVDMHQYPSQGEPQPVAKVGWNIVEQQLK